MKILVIVTSNKIRNLKNRCYNEQEVGLAKALNRIGYVCDVAYYGGENYSENQYKYDGDKSFLVYLIKGIDIFKNAIFDNMDSLFSRYDILMPITYDHFETMRIAKKYPKKTVVYHGTYYSSFNKRYNLKCKIFDKLFMKVYLNRNTKFVTKNPLATEFLKMKGITNVETIGVGLDLEQLNINKSFESEISKLLVSNKRKGISNILYVGKIEKRRNIIFLFDVFERIKKKNTSVKLVLIGDGSDDYKKDCFEYAKKLGIDDDIIYTRYLEQKYLPQIYNNSTMFLLPTSYEIFGMVLLEALFFGIPVITTNNGGSSMLIKNDSNGYIIDKLNIDKWAFCALSIIEDETVRKRISVNASNNIRNNFTWDKLAYKFTREFIKLQ